MTGCEFRSSRSANADGATAGSVLGTPPVASDVYAA